MGTEPISHPITFFCLFVCFCFFPHHSLEDRLHAKDSSRTVYSEGALRFELAVLVHLCCCSDLTGSRVNLACASGGVWGSDISKSVGSPLAVLEVATVVMLLQKDI